MSEREAGGRARCGDQLSLGRSFCYRVLLPDRDFIRGRDFSKFAPLGRVKVGMGARVSRGGDRLLQSSEKCPHPTPHPTYPAPTCLLFISHRHLFAWFLFIYVINIY